MHEEDWWWAQGLRLATFLLGGASSGFRGQTRYIISAKLIPAVDSN